MKKIITAGALMALTLSTFAAEIIVEPGIGTLYEAYDNAAAGDTLLLKPGSYHFDSDNQRIYAEKPIHIKGMASRDDVSIEKYSSQACFIGSSAAAAVVEVTVENLTLNCSVAFDYGKQFNLINVVSSYSQSFGSSVENVLILGGNFSNYFSISSNNSIVAGSIFTERFKVDTNANNAKVLGNLFSSTGRFYGFGNSAGTSNNYAPIQLGAKIISFYGNTVENWLPEDSAEVLTSGIVSLSSFNADIRNNRFHIAQENNPDYSLSSNKDNYYKAIYSTFESGSLTIENNVFHTGSTYKACDDIDSQNCSTIYVKSNAKIRNNIFSGAEYRAVGFESQENENLSLISNNIFFGSSVTYEDRGNLSADPLFADDQYRLTAESPAIDAGVDAVLLKDVDGTRSDIGVYGGLFPINQFDVQLEVDRTEPYLYPLMKAQSGYSSQGGLLIDYIGYARQ